MLFLVAENESTMRFVIEAMISEAFPEVQVLGFENGQLAFAAFEKFGADLVVTDHFMPVMNGMTFVHNLRRLRPMLPILMLSGSPDVRALAEVFGVSVFVDKDQINRELVKQIKLLLAGSIDHHSPSRHAAAA